MNNISDIDNLQIEQFFKIAYRIFKKHGFRKIMNIFRQVEIEDKNLYFPEIYNFIIETVSESFGIEKKYIFNFEKRGEITIARKIAILMIKKYLTITDLELSAKFGRCEMVVYKIRKEFEQLDPQNKQDRENFLDKYDEIDEIISQYCNKFN